MNLYKIYTSNKYWLRGGIMGVTVALVCVIIFLLDQFVLHTGFLSKIVNPIISLATRMFSFIIPMRVEDFGLALLLGFIKMITIVPLFYFVLGSVVGWLYGKIKNHNSSPSIS